MLYDQVERVIDLTTKLANSESERPDYSGCSQEGLLNAFAGKEGGNILRLGERVLTKSGNIETALKKAFDTAFSRAEKKLAVAGTESVTGLAPHVEDVVQHIFKFSREDNPLPYYRTALRLALSDNSLSGRDLKEIIKVVKAKVPDIFVPYEEKSVARNHVIHSVSNYDTSMAWAKTNFSEKRLNELISARDVFRGQKLDGFAPVHPPSITHEASSTIKQSGVSIGKVAAGLAIAAAVAVGAKRLLSSAPTSGGEQALAGYKTKVTNWVKSIRIPKTKLSVGESGDLLVNGVTRSKAGSLGDHLGETTLTTSPSKLKQLLQSVKSGFSSIPELISKASSSLYHAVTSGSSLMRFGKIVGVSIAMTTLIASALFFIVIGAVRLVPNLKTSS